MFGFFEKKKEFCCTICGSKNPQEGFRDSKGDICKNCADALEKRDLTCEDAFLFTEDQRKNLCNPALDAVELADSFKLETAPLVLQEGEYCYYYGDACGGHIKTVTTGYTGRNKIIKFAGCYHGHSDALLVKAGSGVMTAGIPDSAGVPAGATQDTLTAVYNNLESVKMLFEENEGQIAAVIVEPVAANMGVVLPKEGFLKGLRELCTKNGTVLIFDEVITGFRLAFGGAPSRYGPALLTPPPRMMRSGSQTQQASASASPR